MLEKLNAILDHFQDLDRRLAEAGSDFQLMGELSKERSDLEPIVTRAQDYRTALSRITETEELIEASDGEMREMAEMELEQLIDDRDRLEKELKSLLVPRDPRDERDVIIEIRAGTGGDEAGLFVSDLLRM